MDIGSCEWRLGQEVDGRWMRAVVVRHLRGQLQMGLVHLIADYLECSTLCWLPIHAYTTELSVCSSNRLYDRFTIPSFAPRPRPSWQIALLQPSDGHYVYIDDENMQL
jgi:hypothetical protein